MRVNEAKAALLMHWRSKQPAAIMLWGATGIGKSAVVRQAAAKRGWAVVDLRLALLNPVDLRGLPVPDRANNQAAWFPPAFLPAEGRDGAEGVLFLDEINSAPPAVQAAAYQLVLDRRVGEYRLPDGWRIVAAGNRMGDQGVTYRMPAPLRGRMIHLSLEASYADWKAWAQDAGVHPLVVAFLHQHPDLLWEAPNPAEEMTGFPTPRSWEFVSRLLAEGSDEDDATRRELIVGAVGHKAAGLFDTYRACALDMPDVLAILDRGERPEVPRTPDLMCATSAALVASFLGRASAARADNLVGFADERMPAEFAAMTFRDILRSRAGQALQKSVPFQAWCARHKDVIL